MVVCPPPNSSSRTSPRFPAPTSKRLSTRRGRRGLPRQPPVRGARSDVLVEQPPAVASDATAEEGLTGESEWSSQALRPASRARCRASPRRRDRRGAGPRDDRRPVPRRRTGGGRRCRPAERPAALPAPRTGRPHPVQQSRTRLSAPRRSRSHLGVESLGHEAGAPAAGRVPRRRVGRRQRTRGGLARRRAMAVPDPPTRRARAARRGLRGGPCGAPPSPRRRPGVRPGGPPPRLAPGSGAGRRLVLLDDVPQTLGLDTGLEFVAQMGGEDARVALQVEAAQPMRTGALV
jgi:hypothetical protein